MKNITYMWYTFFGVVPSVTAGAHLFTDISPNVQCPMSNTNIIIEYSLYMPLDDPPTIRLNSGSISSFVKLRQVHPWKHGKLSPFASQPCWGCCQCNASGNNLNGLDTTYQTSDSDMTPPTSHLQIRQNENNRIEGDFSMDCEPEATFRYFLRH